RLPSMSRRTRILRRSERKPQASLDNTSLHGKTATSKSNEHHTAWLVTFFLLMLLILSQRRLKLENLKLDLLDLLECGDLVVVNSVAHFKDHPHEEHKGAPELKRMTHDRVHVPIIRGRNEQQNAGDEIERVEREVIPAKRSCVLGHQHSGLFTIGR